MNEHVMLLYKLAGTLFAKLAEAQSEIVSLENHIDKMRLHADEIAMGLRRSVFIGPRARGRGVRREHLLP